MPISQCLSLPVCATPRQVPKKRSQWCSVEVPDNPNWFGWCHLPRFFTLWGHLVESLAGAWRMIWVVGSCVIGKNKRQLKWGQEDFEASSSPKVRSGQKSPFHTVSWKRGRSPQMHRNPEDTTSGKPRKPNALIQSRSQRLFYDFTKKFPGIGPYRPGNGPKVMLRHFPKINWRRKTRRKHLSELFLWLQTPGCYD